MNSVEINDAVECDFFIAEPRIQPEGDKARTCDQCNRSTWAHTDACMWCGHDKAGRALRWVVLATCALIVLVIFPLFLGIR